MDPEDPSQHHAGSPAGASPRMVDDYPEESPAHQRRPSEDYGQDLSYGHADDYSEFELEGESLAGESLAGRSAAGTHYSRASRADSRLDRDLQDAIEMVKVSDTKIGALRKMHAQYLLRRVEEALGGNPAQEDARRLLDHEHGEDRDSDYSGTDDESSLADSAFISGQYRTAAHHKYSGSGMEFDRMSARLEKEMGLGTDNESLASLKAASLASDPENPVEYCAGAFNGQDLETGSIFSQDDSDGEEEEKWRKMFKRRVTINKVGCSIMAFWFVAFIFYMYVRITKTMDLGPYLAYGIFVLVVEVFGASATALYGINLLLNPVPPEQYKLHPEGEPKKGKADKSADSGKGAKKQRWWRRKGKKGGSGKDAASTEGDLESDNSVKLDVEASGDSFASMASSVSRTPSHSVTRSESSATMMSMGGGPELELAYHVRVLIPCYSEPTDIVQKTLLAIREAALPTGCSRTIYLLDDGKDRGRRKWATKLGPDVVYVSGRKRPPGESNGKSGNLNNALSQIYPDGCKIPITEVVCVMDADQVASPDFFLKMIPLMDDGDDVAMVLSPQCFHNTNANADIFNHSNIHFWEYMQIGYDALSFISCSGTNFLIRANAFQECGWSPTWTLTEDFALGMELKKRNWQCRYMREFLAVGEAPTDIRNCFQQKSRWCKGHFQVLFHSDHCPVFQHDLSWLQRVMYLQGVWSYIVGSLCTPTFIVVPIVTIWAGVFPIVLNFWAAVGLTIYYLATTAVLYYVRDWKHLGPLWFSNIANQIMWFTYVKAFWRGIVSAFGTTISFKTTLKGSGRLAASNIGDLWMPTLVFVALLASLIEGLIKLVNSANPQNTLLISLVWVVYNMIPPFLLLWYKWIGHGGTLRWVCKVAMIVSTLLGFGALVLIWCFYPSAYDYGRALGDSHFFFKTQRVGRLPANNGVSWRADSLLQEQAIKISTSTTSYDLSGGYMTNGQVGTVKMTMPIAWTTAMVAWGMLDFKEGYTQAGEYQAGLEFLVWSCEYLLKTIITGGSAKPATWAVVWQVGNETVDSLSWSRPEDITTPRSFYYNKLALNGASDLNGQIVGALAATALVFKTSQPTLYDKYMNVALPLYGLAIGQYQNYYLQNLKKPECIVAPNLRTRRAINCNPPTYPLNGSSADTYNSTSFNDDIAWAAMWMYRSTGDGGYLDDAKQYFGAYQSSTEADQATNLIVDWNNNYWSTAILLASQTDLDAYHFQAQSFLHDWICSSDVITYTLKGRAWNANKGSMDVTANAAMMAAVYGKSVATKYKVKSDRYICWAKGQIRFLLGDVVNAAVVGFQQTASHSGFTRIGNHGPNQARDRAASCPNPPASCNFINGLYNPSDNPHTIRGALVEGSSTGVDTWPDVRTRNESRVALEYNAGYTSALAAFQELASPSWPQCLQGYGYFSKDPVCG
jgi:cellulose synthase/poly-beta-1,6-N-acetylglucosamine synthase-like glycosyltransferase